MSNTETYMLLPMWKCETQRDENQTAVITINSRLGANIEITLNPDGTFEIDDGS